MTVNQEVVGAKPTAGAKKKGSVMINSKLTITIKTDKKGENIDFIYKRKDILPLEDKKEKAFMIFVEQLIRGVLDNGFTAKGSEDGEVAKK